MSGVAISNKCNNNCLMCPVDWRFSPPDNPTPREVINKLKKDRPLKDPYIAISGGEPTLNKDLLGILSSVKKEFPEKELCLLTNGRMFAYREYALKFASSRLDNLKIAIPIHGHSQNLHDSITASPGSFRQTIAGLRNLLEKDLPVEIRVVINRLNFKHLLDIAKFIRRNFSGALYVVFIAMEIEGKAVENREMMAPKYKEFIPDLEASVDYLLKAGIDIRLYHFPLCLIKPGHWNLCWNSVERIDVQFLPVCKKCGVRKFCMGALKSYARNVSRKEFKAINHHPAIIESSNKQNPILRVSGILADEPGNSKK